MQEKAIPYFLYKRRTSFKRRTFGYPHWNKRLPSNKRRTSKCSDYYNSDYILLL